MTEADFRIFLAGAAGLCAVLAVFNLLLQRRRGVSAYLMSGACLAIGFALFLWRDYPSQPTPIAFAILGFLLMCADMVARARPREP
jgi:hypothetical protein